MQAIVAAVAVVAATYLAGQLLYRLRDVILLLLLAGFFAVLLNPAVAGLQHRGIRRRGMAVFVMTALTVLVFAGLAAAFGYPLSRGIANLAHGLPGYVARAEHGRGWAGHLVRHYHVAAWVRRNEAKLVRFGQELARPALTVGKGAVSVVAALVTVFVLVVLLLLEGPALMEKVVSAMTHAHGERFSRIAGEASRAVLVGATIGGWLGGVFGGFVAALLAVPTAVALQTVIRDLWRETAPGEPGQQGGHGATVMRAASRMAGAVG